MRAVRQTVEELVVHCSIAPLPNDIVMQQLEHHVIRIDARMAPYPPVEWGGRRKKMTKH